MACSACATSVSLQKLLYRLHKHAACIYSQKASKGLFMVGLVHGGLAEAGMTTFATTASNDSDHVASGTVHDAASCPGMVHVWLCTLLQGAHPACECG